MPRHKRVSPDGFVQHVLNRGDHRETLFHKPADFRAFLAIVTQTASRVAMRILAYCIMRNHFHLVLWPYEGADLPRFMQVLMNLHIHRYLRHYPPPSPGHIYQDRYTNVLVQNDAHFYRLVRYVEANAKSAGVVQRAEDYKWSSASPFSSDPDRPVIAEWPSPKPSNLTDLVNEPIALQDLQHIQRSGRRGAPYGSDEWAQTIAKQYDLEHTLRSRGRPKVYESDVLD